MKPNKSPKSEPALELHSKAAPRVEAHQHSDGPDAGENSGGRRVIKKKSTVYRDIKTENQNKIVLD